MLRTNDNVLLNKTNKNFYIIWSSLVNYLIVPELNKQ